MSLITKPYTFTAGTTAVAAQVNADFDALYNDYNGNITDANIAAGANISSSKLAPITAGGKVNLSALTVDNQAAGDMIYADTASHFTRLPKGTSYQVLGMNSGGTAQEWQDTGTGPNDVVRLDSSGKLPAVDGSQLTGVGGSFGAWDDTKSEGTVYQAATDGFVIGYSGGGTGVYGLTGSSNPPITIRGEAEFSVGAGTFTMPVRKGDYWKVVRVNGTPTYPSWIPLG